jgi:hypothetical protein
VTLFDRESLDHIEELKEYHMRTATRRKFVPSRPLASPRISVLHSPVLIPAAMAVFWSAP